MEQYRKHVIFGFLLFTLMNGVLSEATCQQKINECLSDAMAAVGVSQRDIKDVLNGDFATMIPQLVQLDNCKFFKHFRECHAEIDNQCENEIDDQMKKMIESFNVAEAMFECGEPEAAKCFQLLNQCGLDAMIASGITKEDLVKIEPPTEGVINPFDLIAQLGEDKGCQYFKSVLECLEEIKEQCDTMPFTQSTRRQIQKNFEKLQCRRA